MLGVVARDPELRLIRSFLAVAEDCHFGRAARRLRITQPALSRQIQRLEATVGAALLSRTSRRVELTAAGEAFLFEARGIFEATDRAVDAARRVAAVAEQRLVIGFIANAAAELTPRILQEFQARYPGVEVELRQFDFADPYAGLAEGESDVAFVRPPLEPGEWLRLETLFDEPRVLIASSTNPVVQRDSISIEAVLHEPFVARKAPKYWRDFWLATALREGNPPRIGAEAATVDECLEAVLLDRGIAFTQQSSERFYARPGLAFVPVTGIPRTAVAVAWRCDARRSMVDNFVATAQAVADDTEAAGPAGGKPCPASW